jgi:DNA-binding SARP family transcriptional activator/TolB-like protein
VPTPGLIEFRLLGSLSVRTEAGREAGAVLAQPKRLALLAYLAAATPHGLHRRDTLLALFWPEADPEHARTSLRKALHFLRQDLGSEVVVSRGDEEVGLDRERCWCDAVAFEEALDDGRSDQALGLYQGDLLAGFHVSDAPEFERWLEETRTRLRARASRAAWVLADEAGASARLSVAVQWAQRAAGLSPYDEVGIRRLVTLLDRAGDRAGAIFAYEQFAQRLSTDLDLEPSADTVALVEAVRTRNGLGPSHNRAVSEAQKPQAAPEGPPAVAAPGAPPQGFLRRRRSARLRLSLLALGATGVIGAIVWRPRSPHHLLASPTAIAVLPFDYRGNPEFSYLAEGMANLVSTKLDGAAGLRSIDPRALLKFVNRDGSSDDPQRGRLAAEHFGAGRFVLGSIVEAGGRLQVSATIYDASARPQSTVETRAESEAGVFDVADRLSQQILAETHDAPPHLTRAAAQSTASLAAFKAYLEGERESRHAGEKRAVEAFQRATRIDTSFALAYYRLSSASWWTGQQLQAREALSRALRHSDRLSEHHRQLVEAMVAFLDGAHDAAERRYRRIVDSYPDDSEAWFMLGLVIQSNAAVRGRAWVDSRPEYERALILDPENALVLWWLTNIAAREGRRADLDSLTDRYLRLNPGPWGVAAVRGQRAIVLGDTAGQARFLADLRTRDDGWAQVAGGWLTATTFDLSYGRRFWRLMTEPSRSRSMQVLAQVTLAKLELTNGRRRAANAALEAAPALDSDLALEHRAFFALTRLLGVPRSELVALRDSLLRWNAAPAPSVDDGLHIFVESHRPARPYLKLYLLGLLSARLGDEAAALRYAAQLGRVDPSSPAGAFAADLSQAVLAEVSWARGRRTEALTTLEHAQFWTRQELIETGDSPIYSHIHERFARAELLYELGRQEEALPWYRSLTYDLLYTAPAHFRLAQIYQARGDRQKAIEHYTSFIGLFREGDPMLQPIVQQAESALARLR